MPDSQEKACSERSESKETSQEPQSASGGLLTDPSGIERVQKQALRPMIDEALVSALKTLSEKAKEGNVQAIKVLLDYAEQLSRSHSNALDFGDLTELERRCLKEALIREIISLRGASGGTGGVG